jgi:hypothetical protein
MSNDAGLPLNPEAPPVQPLSLGEAIGQLLPQYWRMVSRPRASTYAEERGKAAWNIVWVQILFLIVFNLIVTLFVLNFYLPTLMSTFGAAGPSTSPQAVQLLQQQIMAAMRAIALPVALSNILLVPLGLFIGVGIFHFIARAFGGTATFLQYLYGYLLIDAPLSITSSLLIPLGLFIGVGIFHFIASSLLGFIPFLGGLLTAAVGIYQTVLAVFMTMGVQRLSGGKATLVVLLPLIVALILGFILSFIIIGAIVSATMHR